MQSPEILTRPENPNPKWPVPKDLIELQPSYKQVSLNLWNYSISSILKSFKQSLILHILWHVQDDWDPDWQSTSSSKVSYLVHRLNALQEANKKIGYSLDEGIDTKHVDEFHSSSQRTSSNAVILQERSRPSNDSSRILPEKVLIFSQFLEHIHVIEQQVAMI